MAEWQFKLEIDDNLGSPFVISNENAGFTLKLGRFNKSEITYTVRNINNIRTKIVRGNEVRVFGDYNTTPVTKQFTGIQIDDVVVGTYKDFIQVLGQDIFKRRRLKRSVNKKYADQEVKLTAEDIVLNFMGGGFTTTGMQNIGVSQPFNMVKEIVDHGLDRITSSSFSEIFMKPDKSVIMRSLQTEDSGITLTDANIFEPESVQVKRSIADSAGIVTVIGGLSTETFDLNKRIIAQSRIPSAPANLLNEEFVLTDERFTTWKGAKEKSLTIINEIGKDFFMFPNSILVKDMTSLPRAGTLVNINSSKLGISNVKFVVDEIGITAEAGATGVTYIELKLGETEQTELETLALLQQVWESDKRKLLDADAITNQAPFSVPIKFAPTITVTITARNKDTNPYLFGDGTSRSSDFKVGFWTLEDGV